MRKQCSTMSKPLSKVPRRYLIAEYMNSEFDFGKWHKISHHTISIPNIFFKYIVIKIVYIYIYRSMIALIHGHAAQGELHLPIHSLSSYHALRKESRLDITKRARIHEKGGMKNMSLSLDDGMPGATEPEGDLANYASSSCEVIQTKYITIYYIE